MPFTRPCTMLSAQQHLPISECMTFHETEAEEGRLSSCTFLKAFHCGNAGDICKVQTTFQKVLMLLCHLLMPIQPTGGRPLLPSSEALGQASCKRSLRMPRVQVTRNASFQQLSHHYSIAKKTCCTYANHDGNASGCGEYQH